MPTLPRNNATAANTDEMTPQQLSAPWIVLRFELQLERSMATLLLGMIFIALAANAYISYTQVPPSVYLVPQSAPAGATRTSQEPASQPEHNVIPTSPNQEPTKERNVITIGYLPATRLALDTSNKLVGWIERQVIPEVQTMLEKCQIRFEVYNSDVTPTRRVDIVIFGVPCGGRGEIDASELTDFLSKHRNEKTGATPLGLVAIRHMQSDSLKGVENCKPPANYYSTSIRSAGFGNPIDTEPSDTARQIVDAMTSALYAAEDLRDVITKCK